MESHPSFAFPQSSLPPLDVLQAALHKTTESLIREAAFPAGDAPRWNEFEWRIAEAAAVMQGISALLASRRRWRGPERWEIFLEEQTRHTFLRQQRIAELLGRLDSEARRAGIVAVGLKGAALHRMGAYPRGDRPMSDVDLLVAPGDVDATAGMLASLNYRDAIESSRHRTFEVQAVKPAGGFGEHVDNPIKIDLHTRISERLPAWETDITGLVLPRDPRPGLNPYPNMAALMRHLLLHAAGNMRARALRFIQLHDIAVLATHMHVEDWQELLLDHGKEPGLWWAFAPLELTARYYPKSISRSVIEATATGCPRLLREAARRHTLLDVSWARLRMQAFPGIEWSRSLPEALVYMTGRIVPGRAKTLNLRNIAANWPYGAAVPWYGLSQGRRIWRWMVSSPPRVQAIYPIRVALGIQPP